MRRLQPSGSFVSDWWREIQSARGVRDNFRELPFWSANISDFFSFDTPSVQPVEIMANAEYHNWTFSHSVLQMHEWVKLKDLSSKLKTIRNIQFSVRASRVEAINALTGLNRLDIVSRTRRFPADDLYVDLDHDVISTIYQNLLNCLDHSERAAEKGRSIGEGAYEENVSHISDQKRAFLANVDKLLGLFKFRPLDQMASDGIYCQATFEEHYALTFAVPPP